jgi:DNA-binding Lrp family transcriptional regulator
VSLDRTDFGILRLLQNNASLSNKQIAAAVGLAPSSAHERLKRLRDDGVLRGTHADVEPAMGIGLEALFLIELSKHERDGVDRFMTEVVEIPEVRSAFLITGRYDFVGHVVARDMLDPSRFSGRCR